MQLVKSNLPPTNNDATMASLHVILEKLVEQVKFLSEKIDKIAESQGKLPAAVRSMNRGRTTFLEGC